MIIFCLVNLMFLIIKLQTELLVMLPPNVWNNLPYDIYVPVVVFLIPRKMFKTHFLCCIPTTFSLN